MKLIKFIQEDVTSLPSGICKIEGVNFDFHRPNSQRKENPGSPNKIIFHWTADSLNDIYDDYHFNISDINGKVYVIKTLKWTEKGQHLWGRNSGSIGITLCSMSGKPPNYLKPTNNMLDTMAILAAEICAWKNISPVNKITLPKMHLGKVIPGSINIDVIADHAMYAKEDGYKAERWDIGHYYNSVKSNTIKYFQDLKSDKRKFIFVELLR